LLWRSGTLTLAKTICGKLAAMIGECPTERNACADPGGDAEEIASIAPNGALG
jgi:hypothetical protein